MKDIGSKLSWVNFCQEDISEALKKLKDLAQDSTVDVLGFGSAADKFSEIFYPGTSTLHTRLRYVIFIPSLITAMIERREIENPPELLKRLQRQLQDALINGNEKKGVIGRTTEDGPVQPPAQTYWNAVNNLGVLSSDPLDRTHLLESLKPDEDFKDGDERDEDFQSYKEKIDPEFAAIAKTMFADFDKMKLRPALNFELPNAEKKYLRKRLLERYPLALSTHLLDWPRASIEALRSPFKITGLENEMQMLLKQAELFSAMAMGATYAYRFALCDYLIEAYKESPQKVQVWTASKQRNLERFDQWREAEAQLQGWDLEQLRTALGALRKFDQFSSLEQRGATTIDKFSELEAFTSDFLSRTLSKRGSERVLNELRSVMREREDAVKKSRSHFNDITIDVPDVTHSETDTHKYLYDFRFRQGLANAKDLVGKKTA